MASQKIKAANRRKSQHVSTPYYRPQSKGIVQTVKDWLTPSSWLRQNNKALPVSNTSSESPSSSTVWPGTPHPIQGRQLDAKGVTHPLSRAPPPVFNMEVDDEKNGQVVEKTNFDGVVFKDESVPNFVREEEISTDEEESSDASLIAQSSIGTPPTLSQNGVVSMKGQESKFKQKVTFRPIKKPHTAYNIKKGLYSGNIYTSTPYVTKDSSLTPPTIKTVPTNDQSTQPSFSVAAFNSPVLTNLSLSRSPFVSPFYSGRTTFGGVASSRKHSSLLRKRTKTDTIPTNVSLVKHSIKPRPSSTLQFTDGAVSHTALKILDTLQSLSTPLEDARKLPLRIAPTPAKKQRLNDDADDGSSPDILTSPPPPVASLITPPSHATRSHIKQPVVSLPPPKGTPPTVTSSTAKTIYIDLTSPPKSHQSEQQQTQSLQGKSSTGKIRATKHTSHYSSKKKDEEEDPINQSDIISPIPLPLQITGPLFATKTNTGGFSTVAMPTSAVAMTMAAVAPPTFSPSFEMVSKKSSYCFTSPEAFTAKDAEIETTPSQLDQFQFSEPLVVDKLKKVNPSSTSLLVSLQSSPIPSLKPVGSIVDALKRPEYQIENIRKEAKQQQIVATTSTTGSTVPKLYSTTCTTNSNVTFIAPPICTVTTVNLFATNVATPTTASKMSSGFKTTGSLAAITSSEKWTCDACWVNNDSTSTKCIACGTAPRGKESVNVSFPPNVSLSVSSGQPTAVSVENTISGSSGLKLPASGGFKLPASGGFKLPASEGGLKLPASGGLKLPASGGLSSSSEGTGLKLSSEGGLKLPASGGLKLPASVGLKLPASGGLSSSSEGTGLKLSSEGGLKLPASGGLKLPASVGLKLPASGGLSLSSEGTGLKLSSEGGLKLPASGGLKLPASVGLKLPASGGLSLSSEGTGLKLSSEGGLKLPASGGLNLPKLPNESSEGFLPKLPMPNASSASNDVVPVSSSISTSTGSATPLLSSFAPPSSNWECPACMISNKQEVEKCVACQTAKPSNMATSSGNKPLQLQQLDVSQTWECPSCMLIHKSDVLQCPACGTSKPAGIIKPTTEIKSNMNLSSAAKLGGSGLKVGFNLGGVLNQQTTPLTSVSTTSMSILSVSKPNITSNTFSGLKFGVMTTSNIVSTTVPVTTAIELAKPKSSTSSLFQSFTAAANNEPQTSNNQKLVFGQLVTNSSAVSSTSSSASVMSLQFPSADSLRGYPNPPLGGNPISSFAGNNSALRETGNVGLLGGNGNKTVLAGNTLSLPPFRGNASSGGGSIGGNTTSVGGSIPSIGGNTLSTGGSIPSIGGNTLSTGGSIPSIGGNTLSIGGSIPSIGGNGSKLGTTSGNTSSLTPFGGNTSSLSGNTPILGSTTGNLNPFGGNKPSLTPFGGNMPSLAPLTTGNTTPFGGNMPSLAPLTTGNTAPFGGNMPSLAPLTTGNTAPFGGNMPSLAPLTTGNTTPFGGNMPSLAPLPTGNTAPFGGNTALGGNAAPFGRIMPSVGPLTTANMSSLGGSLIGTQTANLFNTANTTGTLQFGQDRNVPPANNPNQASQNQQAGFNFAMYTTNSNRPMINFVNSEPPSLSTSAPSLFQFTGNNAQPGGPSAASNLFNMGVARQNSHQPSNGQRRVKKASRKLK